MTKAASTRRLDGVAEQRCGSTVLAVYSWFKQEATNTTADKMAKSWRPRPLACRDRAPELHHRPIKTPGSPAYGSAGQKGRQTVCPAVAQKENK